MIFDRPLLVVGDSMLDRYWEGDVERISPEAPVPVLQVRREFSRAGGAANVALNLAALGAPVALLTLVGADEAGDALAGILRRAGVTLHAVGGHRHRTTQKIRCVAQRHQLLRTDFEEAAAGDCVADLCAAFADVLPDDGVVVLSDYAKGALSHCGPLIEQAHQHGCRVLCDPKGTDFERYRGADLLKPNAAELRRVVGAWPDEAALQKKCRALRRRLGLAALLVTRGDAGMTLFDAARTRHHPADVRDVFDVSGAGDTVLATLAAFLAAGHALDDCVRWANRAAGLAVAKFGTATVTLAELEAAHGALPAAPGVPRAARASAPRSVVQPRADTETLQ
jgi:D-glycero-beta-D-manno-heptose-7-phosphate kinase